MNNRQRLRTIFLYLLSAVAGATFLYAAYTKLLSLQPFEYSLVDSFPISWMVAAIGTRLLVSIELSIGVLLCFSLYGRDKWVLKSTLLLLITFSGYIVYLWATKGNKADCGCFGDAIKLTPAQSLVKNGVLLALIVVLLRYHAGWRLWLALKMPVPLLLVAFLVLVIAFPLPTGNADWLGSKKYKLDLQPLYAPPNVDTPGTDLQQGKYVLCFFSQGCHYCRMAAYKVHVMQQHNPHLRLFMIIAGDGDLSGFWKETQAGNVPYSRIDAPHFLQYTGGSFPQIYYVDNGWVVAKIDYPLLNESSIEKWLKQ
jgi:hypothetical protein